MGTWRGSMCLALFVDIDIYCSPAITVQIHKRAKKLCEKVLSSSVGVDQRKC